VGLVAADCNPVAAFHADDGDHDRWFRRLDVS